MYDIAIIGAGINGCSMAYEMAGSSQRVLLFDSDGIASGGSGAAGAFIAPKFSKGGELKELLHTAFVYSLDFYEKNFPTLFTKTKLLHIAKDEADAQILSSYKKETQLKLLDLLDEREESIAIEAGIVSAEAMCRAMAKSAKILQQRVESLEYIDGSWVINENYTAKNVILATGAYEQLIQEPYIELRGVWGHRIDIKTSTNNPHSLHQFVSISPSCDGIISIGATHNLHYHPQTAQEAYAVEEGRAELLEKASRTLELEDVEVIRDYTGLRSGSFDYMPMIGPLVISRETLQTKGIVLKTKKPDYSAYSYYPNLYMINGSGGYGFVLAPYLAKLLREHIVQNREISPRLSPARFFARWAKRL